MLEGKTCVPEIVPEANDSTLDLRFKAIRDFRGQSQSGSQSQSQNYSTIRTDTDYTLTSSVDPSVSQQMDTRSY
jgi:hypothetical protein